MRNNQIITCCLTGGGSELDFRRNIFIKASGGVSHATGYRFSERHRRAARSKRRRAVLLLFPRHTHTRVRSLITRSHLISRPGPVGRRRFIATQCFTLELFIATATIIPSYYCRRRLIDTRYAVCARQTKPGAAAAIEISHGTPSDRRVGLTVRRHGNVETSSLSPSNAGNFPFFFFLCDPAPTVEKSKISYFTRVYGKKKTIALLTGKSDGRSCRWIRSRNNDRGRGLRRFAPRCMLYSLGILRHRLGVVDGFRPP